MDASPSAHAPRGGPLGLISALVILAIMLVAGCSLSQRACFLTLSEQCASAKTIDGSEVVGYLSYTANVDESSNANPGGTDDTAVFVTCGAAGLVSYTTCLLKGSQLPPGPVRDESALDTINQAFSVCPDIDLNRYIACLDEGWPSDTGGHIRDGGRISATSPDGTTLAYILTEAGQSELKLARVDGTEDRLLLSMGCLLTVCEQHEYVVPLERYLQPPSWSPDGTHIAFEVRVAESSGIFIIRPDGTGLEQLTSGHHINPQWSPDGRLILFEVRRGECQELAVVHVESHIVRRITRWPRTSLEGIDMGLIGFGPECTDHSPVWSPDSTQVAFMSAHRDSDSHVFIVKADGSQLTTIEGPPAYSRSSDNSDLQWR